jgi:hypothetical protein
MNLIIKPSSNKLETLICKENTSIELIKDFIDTDLLLETASNEYNGRVRCTERDMLYKYLKLFKNGSAKVKYIRNMPYGRVIADKGLSVFNFRKVLRHSLCDEYYADIDMVACHHVILEQLCTANNISCTYLQTYINQRYDIIKTISEKYNISDKSIVKTFFITLMYGGTFRWFLTKNNINYETIKDHDITGYIENLEKELTDIKTIIMNANPDLINAVKLDKANRKIKKYNLINTSMSIYLQDFECRILEQIYIYCVDNKYIVGNNCILSYDGIMISRKKYKPDLLCELERHIYDTLNIKIKLINKPMDEALPIEHIKSHMIDRLNFKAKIID